MSHASLGRRPEPTHARHVSDQTLTEPRDCPYLRTLLSCLRERAKSGEINTVWRTPVDSVQTGKLNGQKDTATVSPVLFLRPFSKSYVITSSLLSYCRANSLRLSLRLSIYSVHSFRPLFDNASSSPVGQIKLLHDVRHMTIPRPVGLFPDRPS